MDTVFKLLQQCYVCTINNNLLINFNLWQLYFATDKLEKYFAQQMFMIYKYQNYV